jgi:hypothetical protein
MDIGELKSQLMSSKDINRNPNVFSPWSFDAAVAMLMPELQRKESLLHEMWGKLMDRDWPKVKLEQELKEWQEACKANADDAGRKAADNHKYEARIESLEKALSYYADPNNYREGLLDDMGQIEGQDCFDNGHLARQVLKEKLK